ncbi:MAG: BTAD domain-containing putative transcriptional regulator [Caldilineaceae bacterium]
MLKLICLGAPQLWLNETSLSTRLSGKALALFLYLAVTGQSHSRARLADLLWSDCSTQQARNNLRYLLPDLRRVVGDYLLITPQSIGFNRQAAYWLDGEVLQTTLTAPPNTISTAAYQAALDLYQAEFLAGFSVRNAPAFEAWVVRQRETLHELVLQGLYTLAERYQQAGNPQAGLAATQRLLHWETWHEAGHRLQMQLLAATGQRSAALAQYVLCRKVLADELGVEPEAATTLLYEQLRTVNFASGGSGQGDRSKAAQNIAGQAMRNPPAPVATLPIATQRTLHNLPSQLTPFIGREAEIGELCTALLAPASPLITLVGEGGVGKTRLALAVAQAILDYADQGRHNPKFPDGVWFVPLSGMTVTGDLADQLATAVAKALGWQFSGRQPLLTQLRTYLRNKALLLLFDNAEQLLPVIGDFLVAILQSCPHITLLVTSRHILNLQAEVVWRVSGLAVPASQEMINLTALELKTYSSMALFVERASRIQRGFQVTAENGREIAAICRLVEGLPLALELAAALTKQYTCTELYAALQRDYSILAANFADLSPRHRSIQAMLDYSWHFLTPEEAYTLAECSLFAGGFTLAAAASVTGATPALLASLVDQSLLQERAGRFILHELVRQYATAQLARTPEHQKLGLARHATYYMDLLSSLEGALLIDVGAQDAVQRELDNIRMAWDWSIVQGKLTLLARGSTGLQCFYRLAGLYHEAIHRLETAIAAVRLALAADRAAAQPLKLLASLLCYTAQFYRHPGKVENGETAAQEALKLGRRLADAALQALAYHELARLAQVRGDFVTMRTFAEQGYIQARQTHLPRLIAECLNDFGLTFSLFGEPLAARPHFHEALHWLRQAADHYLESRVVSNLGFIYLGSHEYQAAYHYLQQALLLKRQLRYHEDIVITLLFSANLWMALGGYAVARQAHEEILAILQTIHNPYWENWRNVSNARLLYLQGDLTAAYTVCTAALQAAQQGGMQLHEQWAHIYLGHICIALGDDKAASQSFQQALATQHPMNWVYHTTDAQAGLAACLLAQNELTSALGHAEAALAQLTQYGLAAAEEPFRVYWTCVQVLRATGDPRAVEVLRTAYQTLQRIAHTLEDEAIRSAFLEDVAANRALCAAAEAGEGV